MKRVKYCCYYDVCSTKLYFETRLLVMRIDYDVAFTGTIGSSFADLSTSLSLVNDFDVLL